MFLIWQLIPRNRHLLLENMFHKFYPQRFKKQFYIPEGFAHGFLTLSDTSEFLYKTTDFYHPEIESCILWNDATLSIKWPKDLNIQFSPKDLLGQIFKSSELFLCKH
jgi:dTDP-4-dehydrorhamnose 3,5-epimerase